MDALRTPDERFDGLPDFPWEPRYAEVPAGDGGALRMAYLDEGSGPLVVCLHGEPSWSFLYRHVVARLLERGCRVVVPDLVGFGRSDKPARVEDHSYAAHEGWLRALLFDALALTDITLVCQDWGGLLGLRLVASDPDRFTGVVATNTGLPDGGHPMAPEWISFRDFVLRTEDLPVSFLVRNAGGVPMTDEVAAAYDAPFPGPEFKAGARAMPSLIPLTPDAVGAAENRAAWEALARFEKPFVCAFSDGDPITRGADKPFLKLIPGTAGRPHATLPGGHFVQEDSGPALADLAADIAAGVAGA